MAYTIKEIAKLAGVTTRTIRYYDEIGLLKPARIGKNGYRYYNRESLLRLQQILFLREMDVPLKDIQQIVGRQEYDPLEALEEHRKNLLNRLRRLNDLITTIDKTIKTIKGNSEMADQDLFMGFDESRYTREAEKRWGDSQKFVQSQRNWAGFSEEQKDAIKAKGDEIIRRMVGTDNIASPVDPAVQAAVADYFAYINKYFYTCDIESLRALAEMWVEDNRFASNYERIREGGASFVRDAVHIYCDQNG